MGLLANLGAMQPGKPMGPVKTFMPGDPNTPPNLAAALQQAAQGQPENFSMAGPPMPMQPPPMPMQPPGYGAQRPPFMAPQQVDYGMPGAFSGNPQFMAQLQQMMALQPFGAQRQAPPPMAPFDPNAGANMTDPGIGMADRFPMRGQRPRI